MAVRGKLRELRTQRQLTIVISPHDARYRFAVCEPSRTLCAKFVAKGHTNKRDSRTWESLLLARPGGFEPSTYRFVAGHSIHWAKGAYWSEWWESNPRDQLGRLEFYHWTTLAYCLKRLYIITLKVLFVNTFFRKILKYFGADFKSYLSLLFMIVF